MGAEMVMEMVMEMEMEMEIEIEMEMEEMEMVMMMKEVEMVMEMEMDAIGVRGPERERMANVFRATGRQARSERCVSIGRCTTRVSRSPRGCHAHHEGVLACPAQLGAQAERLSNVRRKTSIMASRVTCTSASWHPPVLLPNEDDRRI